MAIRQAWLAAGLLVLWCDGAGAVYQARSLYTAIDPAACAPAGGGKGDARLCKGLPGYPVYVAEGGLRTYLSVGPDPARRRAARQTLKAINTLSEGRAGRATVEWRFVVRKGQPVPYATIVRYFTQSGSRRGEVLVVTRVTDRDACHVAYVDALANQDAIVLARRLADTVARSKECPPEPAVKGVAGQSPM